MILVVFVFLILQPMTSIGFHYLLQELLSAHCEMTLEATMTAHQAMNLEVLSDHKLEDFCLTLCVN